MYKELIRNKCIDISRLLLLRAKELQINDNECHILMLVYTLKDIGIQTVTPQMIQNYSMLSNQELNKVLASLLNKNLIYLYILMKHILILIMISFFCKTSIY